MMAAGWSLDRDLAPAVAATPWAGLAGAHVFITGGTGFIGRWMIEALVRAPIDCAVTVLSRDPGAFLARAPHLAGRVAFVAGDVRSFAGPLAGITHVVHGATDASAALTASDPRLMFDTILDGTRRALELARTERARFLLMSSGAVYGVQPPGLTHVDEDHRGGPDLADPRSAYAEGKRAAETLCAIYRGQFGVDVVIARIFALLGPMLSLDIHFAAGNFIRDAMAGRTITVQGSGEAVRSYLYAADLAAWLWTMLIAAPDGATYNVGSEDSISIAALAQTVARVLGAPGVEILGRADAGWNPGRYVPATRRVRDALGVAATIDLDEAIRRTAAANGWTP